MRKPIPISEIFDLINTAHLSSLMAGSREPAVDIRKWLLANRSEMSPECAQFLNHLGLKKKGFSLALKRWVSQFKERQRFIQAQADNQDHQWLLAFGEKWKEMGGVFFTESGEDRHFTEEEIKKTARAGAITLLNEAHEDGLFINVLEVMVSNVAKLNPIYSLLDRCGLPIVNITTANNKTVVHIAIGSPSASEFNLHIQQCQLPQFADALLDKRQ
ncbi:MAG: hypothetical protein CL587_03445 [Alteromonadaceae bacterium]|nr:hypothetical protein [Alteromonadaceae bacterium]